MSRTGTSDLYSQQPAAAAEAAILFAAGHAHAAMEMLRGRIEAEGAGCGQAVWTMLLEIFRACDKAAAFQSLAARYVREFACAPPEWKPREEAVQGPRMLRLKGVLAMHTDVAALIAQARVRNIVPVDMGGVTRIDFCFAGPLCALLNEYSAQGKRIILANVSELNAQLLEAVAAPRRVTLLRREAALPALQGAAQARAVA